jgi:hypothetical protein
MNESPQTQAEAKSGADVSSNRLLGFGDALRIARGCLDYGGGHRSDEGHLEIYHHGIQTVINALEAAEKNGLADTQCAALWRMGREKPNRKVSCGQ